jgi:hypothetical protein
MAILLAIAFFFFSFTDVWGANWVKLHETKDEILFYDSENITQRGSKLSGYHVKVWVKTVYKKGLIKRMIDRVKGGNVAYTLYLFVLHCSSKSYTTLEEIEYSYDGRVLRSYKPGPFPDEIPPGTKIDFIYNQICAKAIRGFK